MTKTTAMHKATKLSWKRANALHNLANPETSRPALARNFLSNNKPYADLFEGKADKRNPKVREALEAYETYCKNPPTIRRKSKGDPTRQVRAGAPTSPTPQKGPKRGGKPRNYGQLSADVLFDLRALQRKHDLTLDEILYCTKVLGDLCDSPINPDHFLKQIKQGRH